MRAHYQGYSRNLQGHWNSIPAIARSKTGAYQNDSSTRTTVREALRMKWIKTCTDERAYRYTWHTPREWRDSAVTSWLIHQESKSPETIQRNDIIEERLVLWSGWNDIWPKGSEWEAHQCLQYVPLAYDKNINQYCNMKRNVHNIRAGIGHRIVQTKLETLHSKVISIAPQVSPREQDQRPVGDTPQASPHNLNGYISLGMQDRYHQSSRPIHTVQHQIHFPVQQTQFRKVFGLKSKRFGLWGGATAGGYVSGFTLVCVRSIRRRVHARAKDSSKRRVDICHRVKMKAAKSSPVANILNNHSNRLSFELGKEVLSKGRGWVPANIANISLFEIRKYSYFRFFRSCFQLNKGLITSGIILFSRFFYGRPSTSHHG